MKTMFDRRRLITASLAAAFPVPALAARLGELAKGAGRVSITAIESFDIQMPKPANSEPFMPTYRGLTPGRNNVVRVSTSAGVNGYSFLGAELGHVEKARALLTGADLFAVEAHLRHGLIAWPSVEEAMWDAIGRIAGEPLCRLMGGASIETMPVYFTYVWPVPEDEVPAAEQARQAGLVQDAGFKAMKIQMMRSDYRKDVEATAAMLAATGNGFRVMVDRTAGAKGLWTYEQARDAAAALAKAGVWWLEEPLARDDYDGPARLRREVPDIIITGGEGWHGLDAFAEGITRGTYGILQPEMRVCAGPMTMRKIGAMCDGFGLPIAPHAATGLALAGRLQVSAAMGSLIQEIGTVQPDTFAWHVWDCYRPVLHGEAPFSFRDGNALVPQHPGLGLPVDEKALEKYRVSGFERRGAKGISPV